MQWSFFPVCLEMLFKLTPVAQAEAKPTTITGKTCTA